MNENQCRCVACRRECFPQDPEYPELPKCNCFSGEYKRICNECEQSRDRPPELKKLVPWGCSDYLPLSNGK